MEFTKGITVKSEHSRLVIVVTEWNKYTFSGIVIAGATEVYPIGYSSDMWQPHSFHPFDLQSAIEEALKNEKV